jgi:hypothetical protein
MGDKCAAEAFSADVLSSRHDPLVLTEVKCHPGMELKRVKECVCVLCVCTRV